jgi:hypothetical protein
MGKKAYCAVEKAHNKVDLALKNKTGRSCHYLEDRSFKSPVWVASKQAITPGSPEGTLTVRFLDKGFSIKHVHDPNGVHPGSLFRSVVDPSYNLDKEHLVPMTKLQVAVMNLRSEMNDYMEVRGKLLVPFFMYLIISIGRIGLADTRWRSRSACHSRLNVYKHRCFALFLVQ